MAEKSFVTAAHHEDVREVCKDPQTEQQYPSKEVFSIEEGGHMKNKTSWLPSDKNKAEHRREKHPEEYRHEQAKRDHELHNAPRSDVPPAFRQ